MLDILKLRREQTYNLRQFLALFTKNELCVLWKVSHFWDQKFGSGTKRIKKCDQSGNIKKAIKKWSPEKCPCRFCKISDSNVGFV